MLIQTITHYLATHRRLVVPQLGTFVVKEPGGPVLFSELLKRDDGVLRGLLRDAGMNDLEAAGEIDRFVFEARHAVQAGEAYPLKGLGTLKPGPNGTIAFAYDPSSAGEAPAAPSGPDGGIPAGAAASVSSDPARPAPSGPSSSANFGTSGHSGASETSGNFGTSGTSGNFGTSGASGNFGPSGTFQSAGASAAPAAAASGSGAPTRTRKPRVQAEQLARSVEQAFSSPPGGSSASKRRSGRSGQGDRPRRRRSDRFLWIAVLAGLIALAAIGFGYWREYRERLAAEAEYMELRQLVGTPDTSLDIRPGGTAPASGVSAPETGGSVAEDSAADGPEGSAGSKSVEAE